MDFTERFNIACKYEDKGEIPKAINEFLLILKDFPNSHEVFVKLGILYYNINTFENSKLCFERALKIKKDYLVYYNLGSVHYRLTNYKKAIINLEKSRNMEKSFEMPSLVIGLCYSRINNLKAAELNFKRVLDLNKNNRTALTAMAIIKYNQKNYEQAIEYLNTLLQNDSSNKKLRELKHLSLKKSGKYNINSTILKHIELKSDGFQYYNEYIKSVPVEVLTDKYGTIDQKIGMLKNREQTSQNSISLSLCHLFKGETETALDYLFAVRGG